MTPKEKEIYLISYELKCRRLRGVMVKVLDCSLEVNEFDLQSRHYIHFRWKVWTLLSPTPLGIKLYSNRSSPRRALSLNNPLRLILYTNLLRLRWRGESFISRKLHVMTSYLLLMTFWPMGLKQCNTDGRSEWTARGTLSKN